jgi:glutamyl-tRNA synthetase
MATLNDLADLLFPDVTKTIADLEKEFPLRQLPEGAEVTRFAPSPTGFLHTGILVYLALIGYTIAKQSPRRFLFPS